MAPVTSYFTGHVNNVKSMAPVMATWRPPQTFSLVLFPFSRHVSSDKQWKNPIVGEKKKRSTVTDFSYK
jgi:hypothetical protein